MGWQLYAGWRTGIGEPGRPEGLPRTATIKAALQACNSIHKKRSAFASDRQVAKPDRHMGDGADYKRHWVLGGGNRKVVNDMEMADIRPSNSLPQSYFGFMK